MVGMLLFTTCSGLSCSRLSETILSFTGFKEWPICICWTFFEKSRIVIGSSFTQLSKGSSLDAALINPSTMSSIKVKHLMFAPLL